MNYWRVEQKQGNGDWDAPESIIGYRAFGLTRDEAVELASLLYRNGGLWSFRVRAYR